MSCPIAISLFQLKYESPRTDIEDFHNKCGVKIQENFPTLKRNVNVGISIEQGSIPLGKSSLNAKSEAHIQCFIYLSSDQKRRVEISNDTITYIDENEYGGWCPFVESISWLLSAIEPYMSNFVVNRTSIRFINKFELDDFKNPEDYFNVVISSANDSSFKYPFVQYGFRYTITVPNSEIYSIINHNVDNPIPNKYLYIFDIDVLDRQNIQYDVDLIRKTADNLRSIRNEMFFCSITEKTKKLWNLQG
ncbi:MAG: TIGR04255 family protein [Paludibacteraceae bacterium]|nr:TIGR04255 family protein [Paludibacteraceae bacterium]